MTLPIGARGFCASKTDGKRNKMLIKISEILFMDRFFIGKDRGSNPLGIHLCKD